jgi:hypothetical protein
MKADKQQVSGWQPMRFPGLEESVVFVMLSFGASSLLLI